MPLTLPVADPTHSVDRIPFFVAEAVRYSMNGRPGAVYLDISGTLVNGSAPEESIVFPPRCPAPPRTLAEYVVLCTCLDDCLLW